MISATVGEPSESGGVDSSWQNSGPGRLNRYAFNKINASARVSDSKVSSG